jgi:tryptophan synthase beta chain
MGVNHTRLARYDLPVGSAPDSWYNILPDLPSSLPEWNDPATGKPVSTEYLDEILTPALVAQERSMERWIEIPEEVADLYRTWRPTPVYRAFALERALQTPAAIYFKYEGASPSGSHKLNSAIAQAYYAKRDGIKRLITDTGAGQWGSALALAGALMGVEVVVYMIRASFHGKPDRRNMIETFGATVLESPGPGTRAGRRFLQEDPDHPGSEATAVSEALEVVREDPDSRFAVGAFTNHVLMHQTVIGLETQQQLQAIGVTPDYLVASVGCGSNMGGFALPWMSAKLSGQQMTILAAEPDACATLTNGEYRRDFADATGSGPEVLSMTLGHEFIPPPIHAGGLRYHGAAPIVGLLYNEGLIQSRSYAQTKVFEDGVRFARLTGLIPAPETAHAISAVTDLALECKEQGRAANIVFCYSGHGLLDLAAYGRHNHGELEDAESFQAPEVAVMA